MFISSIGDWVCYRNIGALLTVTSEWMGDFGVLPSAIHAPAASTTVELFEVEGECAGVFLFKSSIFAELSLRFDS